MRLCALYPAAPSDSGLNFRIADHADGTLQSHFLRFGRYAASMGLPDGNARYNPAPADIQRLGGRFHRRCLGRVLAQFEPTHYRSLREPCICDTVVRLSAEQAESRLKGPIRNGSDCSSALMFKDILAMPAKTTHLDDAIEYFKRAIHRRRRL